MKISPAPLPLRRSRVTTAFEPRPLPSIARRMNRGVSAQMAMTLYLLERSHIDRRLAESTRETFQPI